MIDDRTALIPWVIPGIVLAALIGLQWSLQTTFRLAYLEAFPQPLRVVDLQIAHAVETCGSTHDLILAIGDSRLHAMATGNLAKASREVCAHRELERCPCTQTIVAPALRASMLRPHLDALVAAEPQAVIVQVDLIFPNPNAVFFEMDHDRRLTTGRDGNERTRADVRKLQSKYDGIVYTPSPTDQAAFLALRKALGPDVPVVLVEIPRGPKAVNFGGKAYWTARRHEVAAFARAHTLPVVNLDDGSFTTEHFYDHIHLNAEGLARLAEVKAMNRLIDAARP